MDIKHLDIKNIQGIDKLIEKGEVYLVGGIVRDLFLNKPSKDIDLVVCKISFQEVKDILTKYGKLDIVGESFGILKYTPNNWNESEPIDIALPRTERKTGKGHKDFETISDPFLPIEIELERRDFTINAMALDMNGNLIDPFNGKMSIQNKKLAHVSEQSFSDDPLRMLRGIQFCSRFDFDFSESTWEKIITNNKDISNITPERILSELDKIYYKGDKLKGLSLLKECGISKILFPNFNSNEIEQSIYSNTRADFYSFLVKDSEEFKNILKGDIITAKGIDAINIVKNEYNVNKSKSETRHIIYKTLKISHLVLDSGILNIDILEEFKNGFMPKNVNDLKLNGNELINLGFKGKEIGIAQNKMIDMIFKDISVNTKESLLKIFRNPY